MNHKENSGSKVLSPIEELKRLKRHLNKGSK